MEIVKFYTFGGWCAVTKWVRVPADTDSMSTIDTSTFGE